LNLLIKTIISAKCGSICSISSLQENLNVKQIFIDYGQTLKWWQEFKWLLVRGSHGHARMVVGFTTTCAISAYRHFSCEFEYWTWQGVLDTTLCDKVCQWLATGQWFSSGTPVSFTNKTDCHDITEILLKVTLNTINQPT
jgi:hypothetical protein